MNYRRCNKKKFVTQIQQWWRNNYRTDFSTKTKWIFFKKHLCGKFKLIRNASERHQWINYGTGLGV